jgi:hypothetical protein
MVMAVYFTGNYGYGSAVPVKADQYGTAPLRPYTGITCCLKYSKVHTSLAECYIKCTVHGELILQKHQVTVNGIFNVDGDIKACPIMLKGHIN